jgi:hypothetical protein
VLNEDVSCFSVTVLPGVKNIVRKPKRIAHTSQTDNTHRVVFVITSENKIKDDTAYIL